MCPRRAISQPRTQNKVLYIAYRPTAILYLLYVILSTGVFAMSAILELFHAHAHLSSRACVFSDPEKNGRRRAQEIRANHCLGGDILIVTERKGSFLSLFV